MSDDRTLMEAVKLLTRELNVKAVILFGSRARGDWMPWSDYDLLIIADFKEKYLDRISKVLDILKNIHLPIEPHPYTISEALEMLRRGNPIIVDALEEGRILYSTAEFEILTKEYEKLKKRGLRRTNTTIVIP
ncbi:MAG: hypothetical protein B6U85_03160 [Desulfurococcales archaeon ex4484_42]|nr:MAG: hypothetical protein B6U85_03160 [Desulfurococcales archaeon ex4484_42]